MKKILFSLLWLLSVQPTIAETAEITVQPINNLFALFSYGPTCRFTFLTAHVYDPKKSKFISKQALSDTLSPIKDRVKNWDNTAAECKNDHSLDKVEQLMGAQFNKSDNYIVSLVSR